MIPVAHPPVVPGPADVLLGRGARSNLHSGNIKLRGLVKEAKTAYVSSTTRDKTEITARIVQVIQKEGGRFLKMQGGLWSVVGHETARLKVSHAFRDSTKVQKKGKPLEAFDAILI